MQKKTICLVTNWYPTIDNPHQGLFFRDQIIAMKDYYDFNVVHINYIYNAAFQKIDIKNIKNEFNIKEYNINIYISRFFHIVDRFRKLLFKKSKLLEIKTKLIKKALLHKSLIGFSDINCFYSICCQSEAYETKILADFYNKSYVISEHGPFLWVGRLLSEENKNAIEKANLFLAISEDKIRQVLMQNVHLPKIKYIGNMVDDEVFELNKSNNDIKTFIAVGANSFYKNYKMLIDVFSKLKNITKENFKLIIVGMEINKGYSESTEEIMKLFNESNFIENTEFILGVSHDKMNKIYHRADAFVMTSIQEGQPVSAIEAACTGLPIFSTRCGGVEDYVDDNIGRIVNINDSYTLALYLKDFLENKISFNREYIREVIINKFGKKVFVKNMHEAFESVMN